VVWLRRATTWTVRVASLRARGEGGRRHRLCRLAKPARKLLVGLCGNGDRLRLLRDNASLTRPAYVEVNLRQIFEVRTLRILRRRGCCCMLADFGAEGTAVTDCHLERWREAGAKEGLVARERLRDGVEAARWHWEWISGACGQRKFAHAFGEWRTAVAAFFGQLLRWFTG